MSENIVVDDSVKITVKFRDIDPNGNEVAVAVSTVSAQIIRSNGSITNVASGEIVQVSSSVYYIVFTPTIADTYTIKFTGTYYVGLTAKSIVVEQKLYVSSTSQEYQPTVTLGHDETIVFASDLSPLYIDPESLLPFFPDATGLEIAEIVSNYSLEVKGIYSLSDDEDGSNLPFNVLEYIRAATACELSRTYGLGGDDEMSLHLGDFTVTNKSIPRNSVTRDNATSWCQIATALRKEMLATKVSPLAMQPKNLPATAPIGTSGRQLDPQTGKLIYLSDRELYGPGRKFTQKDDPMPKRGLRSYD